MATNHSYAFLNLYPLEYFLLTSKQRNQLKQCNLIHIDISILECFQLTTSDVEPVFPRTTPTLNQRIQKNPMLESALTPFAHVALMSAVLGKSMQ